MAGVLAPAEVVVDVPPLADWSAGVVPDVLPVVVADVVSLRVSEPAVTVVPFHHQPMRFRPSPTDIVGAFPNRALRAATSSIPAPPCYQDAPIIVLYYVVALANHQPRIFGVLSRHAGVRYLNVTLIPPRGIVGGCSRYPSRTLSRAECRALPLHPGSVRTTQ